MEGTTICLIIIKPPGKPVARRELKEAFRINSDGAGVMYNTGGKVHILKGWFGFRKFYKSLRALIRQFPQSTFVIHMRIGTSGKRDMANCHPFRINERAGFVHNGVMHSLGDNTRSDTMMFVEDVLCKLPDRFWVVKDIVNAIEECAVTSSSKYVLLSHSGECIIWNSKSGNWRGGCWYSNYSYILPPKAIIKPQCTASYLEIDGVFYG